MTSVKTLGSGGGLLIVSPGEDVKLSSKLGCWFHFGQHEDKGQTQSH